MWRSSLIKTRRTDMNLSAFLASLGAALVSRLSSVGAALAASFGTLVIGFTADEKTILLNVKQKFHDSLVARQAAGASTIDAIEGAGSDAWNEFCAEETAEFYKEKDAVITLAVSSAKSAAGIVKTAVAG
jgi:hypothetical protein